MMVVGITGGIGSGKTTVANMFVELGIPLYVADDQAKLLMNTSPVIKQKLVALFGEETYLNNQLNRPFLASQIFQNKELLNKMNAIVHPEVGRHFEEWKKQQVAPYVLKEAAIIFENNLQAQYDYIITVVADLDKRISRVVKRDETTEEKVLSIVSNQLSDREKEKLSDFVIRNHDLTETHSQVLNIHSFLLKNTNKK